MMLVVLSLKHRVCCSDFCHRPVGVCACLLKIKMYVNEGAYV